MIQEYLLQTLGKVEFSLASVAISRITLQMISTSKLFDLPGILTFDFEAPIRFAKPKGKPC
jgi:hypothetical protein